MMVLNFQVFFVSFNELEEHFLCKVSQRDFVWRAALVEEFSRFVLSSSQIIADDKGPHDLFQFAGVDLVSRYRRVSVIFSVGVDLFFNFFIYGFYLKQNYQFSKLDDHKVYRYKMLF